MASRSALWRVQQPPLRAGSASHAALGLPDPKPPPSLPQCNLAFDRVSLKGGRKGGGGGGGGMGSTIGLGLPMGLLGGAPSFL